MTAPRTRLAWTILALLLLSGGSTTVSADPGDPEVVNTICQTWNSTSGICDDYNYADDETASMEWIEGRYNVNMANATMMSVTLEWAIHEVRRDDVLLGDLPLGNGSSASTDGIPADYLRNYFDYVTTSGSTVKEMLRSSVSSTVTNLIDNGFGTSSEVQTSYVNQITYEDQTIQCTDNPDFDSADEVAGLPNDAYNPPLCLRTTLSIDVDPAELGMTAIGLDVERTYQGLLTMGSTVRTDINISTLPGHVASYEFVPPSYGTVVDLSGDGNLVPATWGGFDYTYARWRVDHTDATDDAWLNQSESITMARRSTTTSQVEIDIENDRDIRVDIMVDASDERATSVEVRLGLHHVGMDTLSNWDWNFADDRVSVPWVTADGLRMAHHTGLANLSDFADKVPIEDLNEAIAEHSPTDIEFETFVFSPPDDTGGLDFVHRPGVTCSEETSSNWCILGQTAMNGTYPVYMTSRSNIFDMDVGEMISSISDEFEVDMLGFDPSLLTKEDRAAILNGIILSGEFDSSNLISWLDDDLPQADIRLEIMLPDYIRSTSGNPQSIVITHTLNQPETQSLTVTGAQPYDWRHPICRESNCGDTSLDLICGANRRTCLGLNLDVEFSDLDIHEWSRSIEMTAEGEMEFLLYRVGVPDSVLEDMPNLEVEAVSSDLIRRFVHLGNQMDGGLLAPLEDNLTVQFEDEDIPFVLTENGLNNFARDVAGIVETQVNEEIQLSIDEMNQDGDIYLKDPGHVSISVSIDGLDHPAIALSDLRPIRILLEVSKTTINVEYVGGSGSGEDLASQSMGLWTNSLLAANGGSGIEVPPGEDLEMDMPTPVFEMDGEVVSPSVRLRVTLPWGIGFSNFKSEMGRGEITENDGSEVLTYYLPLCNGNSVEVCEEQSDTLSFRMTIGIDYILNQLIGYISILVGLIVLLLMWRRSRKRRKKEKEAKEESDIVGHRMSDLQILEEDQYGEDGLPDMDNFAGLDEKGNVPSESWEDDLGF